MTSIFRPEHKRVAMQKNWKEGACAYSGPRQNGSDGCPPNKSSTRLLDPAFL